MGDTIVAGDDGRHPARATRCRCENIPLGTDDPQRRAAARQGRPDGPLRRRLRRS
ncbi:MAG: hypothetical protein MZV70_34320 [Desulfobacterales bacterium]|nr:hypothetical protein [Desulfobacterales bacterium]